MRRPDSRPAPADAPADAPSRALAEAAAILGRYEASSRSALTALESHDVRALAEALDARELATRELSDAARFVERALAAAALGRGSDRVDAARLLVPVLQASARATTLDARLRDRTARARDEIGDEIARLPAATDTGATALGRDATVRVDVLL